jgi:hypothetical protein
MNEDSLKTYERVDGCDIQTTPGTTPEEFHCYATTTKTPQAATNTTQVPFEFQLRYKTKRRWKKIKSQKGWVLDFLKPYIKIYYETPESGLPSLTSLHNPIKALPPPTIPIYTPIHTTPIPLPISTRDRLVNPNNLQSKTTGKINIKSVHETAPSNVMKSPR